MNPIHLYANLFLERRWLVGLFIVIVTAVAVYGQLTTANSDDHFASLPERRQEVQQLLETRFASNAQRDAVAVDDPQTAALKANSGQLQTQLNQWQWDNFDNQDFFIVVQGEDVFRPQTIAALREMVAKVNQLDAVYRVLWLDQVPIFSRFGVPGPILPADDATDDEFAKAKTNVLAHPIAPGYLISEDGTVLLFSVAVQWHQVQQVAKMVQDVRSTAKGVLAERNVDVDFYLAGRIPIMVEQRASLRRNQVWFQFLGYGLAFFITLFLFRGVGAVMIVAGAPALGIVWATGILKLIDAPTNMLTSIILPVLVSMVGLTDGIHLMMHIRKCRARGVPAREAAAMSVRLVGLACFLTSFTTCVGFGSLRLAHSEYIRDFGYACAIGVVISFFAVITVIPFLCTTFLGKRIDRGHDKDVLTHQLSRSEWVIDRVIARPRKYSWWAIGLTLVLLAASFSLRPDNNTKSSLPKDTESFQVLSLCDEKLGGIDQAQILVRWDQGTDRKTFLEVIDKVERTLDAEPLFGYSLSVHDLYESLQPGYRQQAADERQAPAIAMLVPFRVRDTFLNESLRRAFVRFRVKDTGIAQYEPAFIELENSLQQLSDETGFRFLLVGQAVRRQRELFRVVQDLAASLAAASVIIFTVIAIVYRSFRLGLISIVPNVFPLAVTACVLAMTRGTLDFAAVCAFTVCLGIAVDDTIHFLTRFTQELGELEDEARQGQRSMVDEDATHQPQSQDDVAMAAKRTYMGIGNALLTTTLIMVLGFGTALTSDLPDIRMFASMACATIGSALIGDMVFLPAMLILFFRPKRVAVGPQE